MLEPRVIRAWVDEISQAELMYAMQPLKLRHFSELKEYAVEPHSSVNGIVYYLVI